jgi:hypothetical protein
MNVIDSFGQLFFLESVTEARDANFWFSLATGDPQVYHAGDRDTGECVFFEDKASADFAEAKRVVDDGSQPTVKPDLGQLLGCAITGYMSDDDITASELVSVIHAVSKNPDDSQKRKSAFARIPAANQAKKLTSRDAPPIPCPCNEEGHYEVIPPHHPR